MKNKGIARKVVRVASTVCLVALVGLGGLLAFASTRPDRFRIERSAEINAPASVVFAKINDFRQWSQWSPYEKLDPGMKKTYTGAAAGPGAVYAWSGNGKAGEGRMTVLESKPGEFVTLKLEFFKPFAATNQAVFRLVPSEGGTRVTWSMEGENSLMGKTISLFMNMDELVGKDFEQGLANLNGVAQAEHAKAQARAFVE